MTATASCKENIQITPFSFLFFCFSLWQLYHHEAGTSPVMPRVLKSFPVWSLKKNLTASYSIKPINSDTTL